jgi:hypothetical protein
LFPQPSPELAAPHFSAADELLGCEPPNLVRLQ